MSVKGFVYLLHFDRPFHHAKHYLGWTETDPRNGGGRLESHANGQSGVKIIEAIKREGIGFTLTRVWDGVDRYFERKLKNQKNSPKLCPFCNPKVFYDSGWSDKKVNEVCDDILESIEESIAIHSFHVVNKINRSVENFLKNNTL